MPRFNPKKFDREFWLAVSASDDLLAIARFLDRDDWKRAKLIDAHREMVWGFAHLENTQIDFDVDHASWVKPLPDSIAGRIAARQRAPADAVLHPQIEAAAS